MSVEVLEPGPLTSIQTAFGRPGWQHLGVPVGGAADPWSARLANRLVGNDDDAPLLECTMAGPSLRFEAPTLIALTGAAWNATLDRLPMPANQSRAVRAGSTLRLGTGTRARGYLAIRGLTARPVLGSPATDLRSGFGGHDGRALVSGDRLEVVPGALGRPLRWVGSRIGGPVRITPGPYADGLAELLGQRAWRVSASADRTGVRFDGGEPLDGGSEVASMGLPVGAIQVPPDGRPIVMLADRPVTGGYPVPACVIRADVGRVAQLVPGDEVTFELVTAAEATAALRAQDAELDALEPFSLAGDEDSDWAGLLD